MEVDRAFLGPKSVNYIVEAKHGLTEVYMNYLLFTLCYAHAIIYAILISSRTMLMGSALNKYGSW